jgi:2-polyprenyl-6-methoxyphenol hydroxylase-like FAD-dependent oxidoreductase
MIDDRVSAGRPVRCVVVGGSLVGLSAAIALSRLGLEVTVVEQSPARAVDGGGGLGVDTALLQEVSGGFRQGLYDVRALTQAMTGIGSPDDVPDVLARYQQARLAAGIRHVTNSEQATTAYLARAAHRADQ